MQADKLQQSVAYGLLENWPLWNTAGDSKQPEQKDQRQGNDRNHPKEVGKENERQKLGSTIPGHLFK